MLFDVTNSSVTNGENLVADRAAGAHSRSCIPVVGNQFPITVCISVISSFKTHVAVATREPWVTVLLIGPESCCCLNEML